MCIRDRPNIVPATPKRNKNTVRGYRRPSARPPKYTRDDFLKPKPGTRNFLEDQEMSSESEFSSIAGASDLNDPGDLAEFNNLQKKKKGWPKWKRRKHAPLRLILHRPAWRAFSVQCQQLHFALLRTENATGQAYTCLLYTSRCV